LVFDNRNSIVSGVNSWCPCGGKVLKWHWQALTMRIDEREMSRRHQHGDMSHVTRLAGIAG